MKLNIDPHNSKQTQRKEREVYKNQTFIHELRSKLHLHVSKAAICYEIASNYVPHLKNFDPTALTSKNSNLVMKMALKC